MLITQPTAAPTRKVRAAAIWGFLATVATAGASVFFPAFAGTLGGILPIVAPVATSLIAAYVTHEVA